MKPGTKAKLKLMRQRFMLPLLCIWSACWLTWTPTGSEWIYTMIFLGMAIPAIVIDGLIFWGQLKYTEEDDG